MATSYRQKAQATSQSSAFQIIFTSPFQSGSLIVVDVAIEGTGTVSSITDTLGNTYAQAVTAANTNRQSIWYAANTPAGTATLTVTLSAMARTLAAAAEYPGIKTSSPLNSIASGTGTSSSPSTGSITAASGELIVAAYAAASGTGSFAASSPFTSRVSQYYTAGMVAQFADDVPAAGSATGGFTNTSSAAWVAVGASFQVQPPPSPPAVSPQAFEQDSWLFEMDGVLFLDDDPQVLTGPGRFPLPPPIPPPPLPPPPIPPGPPVPPIPPLPPPPIAGKAIPQVARDSMLKNASDRRSLEMFSLLFNSLCSTGQIVQTDETSFVIVAPGTGGSGGFTGIAGVP